MATLIITFVFVVALAYALVYANKAQLCHSPAVLIGMFWYHLGFWLLYYWYTLSNNTDSKQYFATTLTQQYGDTWLENFGVGTQFIRFLSYPFIHYFGFGYEAMMLLFAFLGFVGIFFFYLFFSGFINYRHRLLGIDVIALALFLPNIHFWSASLGKGSVMLMGLGLLFYGLQNVRRNVIPLIIGGILVFHIRAHILGVILVGSMLSILFSSKGIKTWHKVVLVSLAGVVLIPVIDTFVSYVGLEEASSDTVNDFIQHRGSELGKATSSVDVNNYSQPMKLFTFLFRPLFIDAPNMLGLFVSFENVFYLVLFLKIVSLNFIRYITSADWLVKLSLLTFLGVSFALAQVSGNMGIAIRQKSQVMYLFVFVLLAYADHAYRTRGKLVLGE